MPNHKHLVIEHQNDRAQPDAMKVRVVDSEGSLLGSVLIVVADGHLEVAVDATTGAARIDVNDVILYDTVPDEVECDNCGDMTVCQSSRGWCDGCEDEDYRLRRDYPVSDWVDQVREGKTEAGYAQWVVVEQARR